MSDLQGTGFLARNALQRQPWPRPLAKPATGRRSFCGVLRCARFNPMSAAHGTRWWRRTTISPLC